MKIMKSYRHLIPIGFIIVFAIGAFILSFHGAIQIFKFHWLVLAAVLIICCSPWGNKQFGVDQGVQKHFRVWAWLSQVIFLELCLAAVFLGIFVTCAQKVPVFTTPQPQLLQDTLYQMLVSEGLFPWATIGIFAISFSFWSYQKNQDAYFASTIEFFAKKPLISIIVNFIGRFVTGTAYSATLCLIGLLWASHIGNTPIATGFTLASLLTSIILILITFSKIYRHYLNKSLGRDFPLILGLFLWVVFFAVAIWLVNGFMVLVAHTQFQTPKLLHYWLKQPWNHLWFIFANSWWLLWTPITAITIAGISRGYSVRSILLATLLIPLSASITLSVTSGYQWHIPPLAAVIASGIGLMGIFVMTLRKTGAPAFMLTYLPRRDHYKFRSYRRTLIQLTKMAVIFLFVYLPSGIIAVHFFIFSIAIPLVVISVLAIFPLFHWR